jgi:hypothetical protein
MLTRPDLWDRSVAAGTLMIKLIAAAAVVVLCGFVIIAAFAWIAAVIGVVALALVIAWACGIKINVSRNNQPIGYVRWFTMYDLQGRAKR